MVYGTAHAVLKPLNEAALPDPRFEFEILRSKTGARSMGLADLHRRLCDWQLLPTVSENIRVQFETARNLMLYAWFVLEFQRVAEMQAYLSLELALRERLGNLTRTKQTKKGLKVLPLMLGDLLSKAVSDGLIIPEKLPLGNGLNVSGSGGRGIWEWL